LWGLGTVSADLYCSDPLDEICWRRAEPLVMAGLGAHRARGGEPRPRALCQKLPTYASPLLPYAQEIEPHTGWHLGNFPEVFSHLALINACVHLIREDEPIAAG
jgi:GH15 family glucan-1,4-alpha-glucosidase